MTWLGLDLFGAGSSGFPLLNVFHIRLGLEADVISKKKVRTAVLSDRDWLKRGDFRRLSVFGELIHKTVAFLGCCEHLRRF